MKMLSIHRPLPSMEMATSESLRVAVNSRLYGRHELVYLAHDALPEKGLHDLVVRLLDDGLREMGS